MHHTSVGHSPDSDARCPAISVIVPVFNGEALIARCLGSLTAQSMRDMEILVVCKPGKDKTLEQIRAVGDPRIRVLMQEEDTGPGGARNMGIQAASGTYLGFVEADDVVDGHFYEALQSRAELHGADIAFAGTLCNGRALVVHDEERTLSGFADIVSRLVNGASFDKLFRASLIREHHIRFSEGVRWEDNIFLLRAVHACRNVVTVPHVFYHYFPGQWTEASRRRLERDAVSVVHEIADFARDAALSPEDMTVLRDFVFRSFALCVWDDASVYRAMKHRFGVPLPLMFRHYRKRVGRLWREAGQAVDKGVRHG